jgi:hypothetical protein
MAPSPEIGAEIHYPPAVSFVRGWSAACLLLVLFPSGAVAADKAACASAAEDGQHLKAANKLVDARKQFLICARADCPAAVSQDCVKWLGETEHAIGSVTINPTDAGGKPLDTVRVLVDGTLVSEGGTPAPMEIDPGHHVVRCERQGFVASDATLEIAPGERRQLDVKLTAAAAAVVVEPPPPKKSSGGLVPIPSWILGGIGVVGFAGFGVFGAMGLADQNNLHKTCAPYCSPSEVAPVNTKFAVADVSLVVGIASLTAAVVVALLWPRAPTASSRAFPLIQTW